jgi:hypothetical protein
MTKRARNLALSVSFRLNEYLCRHGSALGLRPPGLGALFLVSSYFELIYNVTEKEKVVAEKGE